MKDIHFDDKEDCEILAIWYQAVADQKADTTFNYRLKQAVQAAEMDKYRCEKGDKKTGCKICHKWHEYQLKHDKSLLNK